MTKQTDTHPDAQTRRGLRIISEWLEVDFDNGFQKLSPRASERKIMEIMAAWQWIERAAHGSDT